MNCDLCDKPLFVKVGEGNIVLVMSEPNRSQLRYKTLWSDEVAGAFATEVMKAGMEIGRCAITTFWKHERIKSTKDPLYKPHMKFMLHLLTEDLRGAKGAVIFGSEAVNDVLHERSFEKMLGLNISDIFKLRTGIDIPIVRVCPTYTSAIGDFRLHLTKFIEETKGV